jgi:predicted Fe-Mo cluster-binding NifX family protein
MKIAIPTTGNQMVDSHFGHCEMYTIVTADEDLNIVKSEILPSPAGCGCKSDIASVLQSMGVKIMLAGGIGEGAINVLNRSGISVVRGCSGNVLNLTKEYLQGGIADSGNSCAHHENHHNSGEPCSH